MQLTPKNIHHRTELPNTVTESKNSTVAEAKIYSSDSLHHANHDSFQFIVSKKSYVLISQETWQALSQPKQPLGQWLVERMAGVGELELPARKEPERLVVKLLNKAGKFSL